ncbi:hypothetical protein PYK79_11585 [Streptomyces sp. ID05-04B]|uniref:Uncharacterized protein n=1 Tax=Staphylococcus warneri TaxID=1292 RepID=A0ABS9NGU8_STAWA|nr:MULTISPECIES: hypothetical protein [Terrabacteria group]DAZ21467.1 MAG TPA: Protein of unknown function (DUF3290) [Caudoviricetes sp.]KTW23074.1 hypothetical protein SA10R_06655 [Staphylococcus warneri]MBC3134276.1 hypothetical protein [Staphylococcus warneri]MCG6209711.1 hypothetical protein [Staphylococcus warneri]MCG6225987.1 hypothetical protein [Staphylococcus warneri]
MSVLALGVIIILGMTLEFLINHKFTNARMERLAELSCIVLTLTILAVGYKYNEWLFSILTMFTLVVSRVRKINLGEE